MTAGSIPAPCARHDRDPSSTMTSNSDKERGEKRGVISSGRANDLDADTDNAANDDDEEE